MKEKPLNSRTPQWFKDWHSDHYKPLSNTVNWNTKLIFVILAAILAASVIGNSNLDVFGKILNALAG